jgi:hypothetical protein
MDILIVILVIFMTSRCSDQITFVAKKYNNLVLADGLKLSSLERGFIFASSLEVPLLQLYHEGFGAYKINPRYAN